MPNPGPLWLWTLHWTPCLQNYGTLKIAPFPCIHNQGFHTILSMGSCFLPQEQDSRLKPSMWPTGLSLLLPLLPGAAQILFSSENRKTSNARNAPIYFAFPLAHIPYTLPILYHDTTLEHFIFKVPIWMIASTPMLPQQKTDKKNLRYLAKLL